MGRRKRKSQAPLSTRQDSDPAIGLYPSDHNGNPRQDQDWLDAFLMAAREHGRESDPDHEVGDLQELAMACWAALNAEQRALIAAEERFVELIEDWS